MDGVIIDSEPVHFRIGQEIFRELGLAISPEEYSEYVGRSDMWHSLKKKYGLDHEIHELHEIYQTRYLSYLKTSYNKDPIEGVVDLIKALDSGGLKLALASSSTMENIEIVLNKYDLMKYFPCRISGDELETSKPHPEIFLKAAQITKTLPRECLVIEDSGNGVRAAKAAGMRCMGYKNPNSGRQNLQAADWIIEHLDEFDLNKFDT